MPLPKSSNKTFGTNTNELSPFTPHPPLTLKGGGLPASGSAEGDQGLGRGCSRTVSRAFIDAMRLLAFFFQSSFLSFSAGTNLPMVTRGAVLQVPGAQLHVSAWG